MCTVSKVGPLGKSSGATALGGVASGLAGLSVSCGCLRAGTAPDCPLSAEAKHCVDDHRCRPVTVTVRMLSVGAGGTPHLPGHEWHSVPPFISSPPLPPLSPTHTQRAPDQVSLTLACRSLIGLMLLTPDCTDFPVEAKSQLRPMKMKTRLHLHTAKPCRQVCGVTSCIGTVCKPSSSCPCLHGSPVMSGSAHAPEFPLHAKSSECPDLSAVVLGCIRERLRWHSQCGHGRASRRRVCGKETGWGEGDGADSWHTGELVLKPV